VSTSAEQSLSRFNAHVTGRGVVLVSGSRAGRAPLSPGVASRPVDALVLAEPGPGLPGSE
jgi:hypothetical protein